MRAPNLIAIIWLLLLATLNAANAATITVNGPADLTSALANAQGGDTLRLQADEYGALDLHDLSFTEMLTIESANANNRARFSQIDIKRSMYLRLRELEIRVQGREGIGIFDGSAYIEVVQNTIYGSNQFDRNTPDASQVSTLYGINTGGSPGVANLLITKNSVTDVQSSAYLFTTISDSTISENHCDWVASDCYKLAGADGIQFTNNFGAQNIHPPPGAHVDFVQGQGTVSNSIFRGNVGLMGSATFQGLFFDDAEFTNLTFEHNVIHNANIRGISVSSGSGIVARYNTVLTVADPEGTGDRYSRASLIILPEGSISEFNIVANITTKNAQRFDGNNIKSQWDDVDDIAHYSDYYVNAMHGPFATIADFTPVKGSAAETTHGAYLRIQELLEPTRAPQPAASTPAILMLLDEN